MTLQDLLMYAVWAKKNPENKLLELINQARAQNNVAPLTKDRRLGLAATEKSADMVNNKYWAHTTPTGKTLVDFVRGAGSNYPNIGENLARNFTNQNDMLQAWLKSPTHREILLSPKYTKTGLGNYGLYNTEYFGGY